MTESTRSSPPDTSYKKARRTDTAALCRSVLRQQEPLEPECVRLMKTSSAPSLRFPPPARALAAGSSAPCGGEPIRALESLGEPIRALER
ncbi:hypothetical protein EYF80_062325 [Liparis tanakae]|uniref:Uncharacterized protein n=1 Tax=Liparis tanakae TaxID=230148 RepID=A0A4Z2EG71_9TELE|nr:hypothetical protein EYF80_062325 [Liparis tanakae]